MSVGPSVAAVALDLRLVPPAVAAWCAAVVVVHAPQAVARAVLLPGALLAGAAAVVLAAAVRHVVRGAGAPTPGRATGPGRLRRAAPAVVLGVATAAAVLVSGAVAQEQRAPAPLTAAAAQGRAVEVVGWVSTGSRPAGGADPRLRFTVTASALRFDGRWHRVAAPVEVVAPAAPPLGSTVQLRGTLTATTRGERAAVVLRAGDDPAVTGAPHPAHAGAGRVRAAARTVAAGMPADVRGLLPAVTVGDTGAVPADLVTAMRAAGLAHVMAVSGAHFAILGALVLAAAGAVGAPLPVRVAAVALAGTGLLLVVGPSPSVVRAAVMGGVGLLGLVAGRRAAGPAALAAAVVALLVADPWLGVDVGFALSVAATAGLVVLGRPLVERWSPRCGRDAAALLAAPVAAQVGCLPVTLALWPTLGPWAVAANLVVAPAVAPATVLGLLAALLAGPWPAAAGVVAAGAGAACWWIAAVARCAAGLPGASLAWWPGAGGAVTAAVAVVAAAVLVLRRPRPG
ncbi:ComEC/Rec2 family competence protein [Cellulomonas sp. S1-8]|uniref:ComEC/Rec2 family competence protein n=1 Tax=Cellulomonas sp. S1-8 TaxID=2904790 RepID=UPI00224455AF|nr:ComEC/Rec2 family competence protein [Cellulomonas sp. S1-8]UZN01815.1 ComEC/Rec2 family competence protein [Cellulomonas sp. S1-8]